MTETKDDRGQAAAKDPTTPSPLMTGRMEPCRANSRGRYGTEISEEETMNGKTGKQTIGCGVTSCRFNDQGCDCELDRIEVKAKCVCHSGDL